MSDADHFRKQAETCLRIAGQTSDGTAAQRLRELAAEYEYRAEGVDRSEGAASAESPAERLQRAKQHAEDCKRFAGTATSEDRRALLLAMAETWLRMAEDAENGWSR
jgi:hypothetical protein